MTFYTISNDIHTLLHRSWILLTKKKPTEFQCLPECKIYEIEIDAINGIDDGFLDMSKPMHVAEAHRLQNGPWLKKDFRCAITWNNDATDHPCTDMAVIENLKSRGYNGVFGKDWILLYATELLIAIKQLSSSMENL